MALRATITKLGPGIIAPSSSEKRMASTALDAVIGLSPSNLFCMWHAKGAIACRMHDAARYAPPLATLFS